jgi:hypothetical protein
MTLTATSPDPGAQAVRAAEPHGSDRDSTRVVVVMIGAWLGPSVGFVAASGVVDGGEDESEVFAVESGDVAAEVDRRSAEERRGDAVQTGLAAGERVLGHLFDVDPPPAGVVALLDPGLAGVGEPAAEGL